MLLEGRKLRRIAIAAEQHVLACASCGAQAASKQVQSVAAVVKSLEKLWRMERGGVASQSRERYSRGQRANVLKAYCPGDGRVREVGVKFRPGNCRTTSVFTP
jgi:hypothetical protein